MADTAFRFGFTVVFPFHFSGLHVEVEVASQMRLLPSLSVEVWNHADSKEPFFVEGVAMFFH